MAAATAVDADAEGQSEADVVVIVQVVSLGGDLLFGPQELPGVTLVSELKDLSSLQGDLVSGQCICKDSDRLGQLQLSVGTEGTTLSLTLVVNIFSALTPECKAEFEALGAFTEFDGQRCLRVGFAKNLHDHGGGSGQGEHRREFMLTGTGQILAKHYEYYRWYDYGDRDITENWWFTLAEGSYSIVDPSQCTVQVLPMGAAERRDSSNYPDGDPPIPPKEGAWKVKKATCESFAPSEDGAVAVLALARRWLGKAEADAVGVEQGREAVRPGFLLVGATAGVVAELGLDPENAVYWQSGGRMWTMVKAKVMLNASTIRHPLNPDTT